MKKIVKLMFVFLVFLCSIDIVFANTNLTIMPISTTDWGDATLLESDGEYLLIDVSYATTTDVIDFLIDNDVQKFDIYLSHYHSDHYGGYNKLTTEDGVSMDLIEYMIRNEGQGGYRNYIYDIGTLYIPDASLCVELNESVCISKNNSLTKAANEMGVEVVVLSTGSTFQVGNTTAEVLYLNDDPSVYEHDASSVVNNTSLVTMFTNGKTKFLTAGDIEQFVENKLVNSDIDISADIFKLSHHALQYGQTNISNTQEFVKAVNPKYSYFYFNIDNEWNVTYSTIVKSIEGLSGFSNVYVPEVNGNIRFEIINDEIIPIVEKNSHKITIKYIDQSDDEVLDTKVYDFSYSFYDNEINYHLYDYEKQFKDYTLVEGLENIVTSGVLKEDITYNLYYIKNQVDLGGNDDTTVDNDANLDNGDTKVDNETNLDNDDTKVDKDGNVNENVQTGDVVIALVWFFGIFAICYAVYYFKSLQDN